MTFLVGSPTLDPAAVTAALRITPTHVAIPGATLETWEGRVLHVDKVGWWALSTADHVPSDDVSTHLRHLLDWLLPHRDALREFARGGELFFELPLPSRSAGTLDAECVRGVENLGAQLEFLGDDY